MINKLSTESEIEERLKEIINDIQKKVDLEQRLKKAFQNSTSHTKSLSQI